MKYILIEWPESQYLMVHHRFNECIATEESGEYLCPEDLCCEIFNILSDKEVFINTATNWIREHRDTVETEDNGISGWIPDYFIEDFKNAMEKLL